MGANAYNFDWAYAAQQLGNIGRYYARWDVVYSSTFSNIISSLQDGHPPILKLKNGTKTHFVVVKGVSGTGTSDSDFMIMDTYDGTNKSLSSYTNNGWSRDGLRIYYDAYL